MKRKIKDSFKDIGVVISDKSLIDIGQSLDEILTEMQSRLQERYPLNSKQSREAYQFVLNDIKEELNDLLKED